MFCVGFGVYFFCLENIGVDVFDEVVVEIVYYLWDCLYGGGDVMVFCYGIDFDG